MRLKPGIEWQRVDDEVVALDLATSAYVAVNESGVVLWPLMAAGTDEEELVRTLVSHFSVDDGMARADVRAFVESLRSLSLLVDDG